MLLLPLPLPLPISFIILLLEIICVSALANGFSISKTARSAFHSAPSVILLAAARETKRTRHNPSDVPKPQRFSLILLYCRSITGPPFAASTVWIVTTGVSPFSACVCFSRSAGHNKRGWGWAERKMMRTVWGWQSRHLNMFHPCINYIGDSEIYVVGWSVSWVTSSRQNEEMEYKLVSQPRAQPPSEYRFYYTAVDFLYSFFLHPLKWAILLRL